MDRVEKLSISLTGDLAELVREAVERGGYASSSEFIREALRQYAPRFREQEAARANLRRLWNEGLDSGLAEAPRTAAEIKAEGRRRLGRAD